MGAKRGYRRLSTDLPTHPPPPDHPKLADAARPLITTDGKERSPLHLTIPPPATATPWLSGAAPHHPPPGRHYHGVLHPPSPAAQAAKRPPRCEGKPRRPPSRAEGGHPASLRTGREGGNRRPGESPAASYRLPARPRSCEGGEKRGEPPLPSPRKPGQPAARLPALAPSHRRLLPARPRPPPAAAFAHLGAPASGPGRAVPGRLPFPPRQVSRRRQAVLIKPRLRKRRSWRKSCSLLKKAGRQAFVKEIIKFSNLVFYLLLVNHPFYMKRF